MTKEYKENLIAVIVIFICSILLSVIASKIDNSYTYSRGILFFATGMIFYIIIKKSTIHKINISDIQKSNKKKIIIFIAILLEIIGFIFPMNKNYIWSSPGCESHYQYQDFADSLLRRNLYIDSYEVDESLINLDNPYNPIEREKKKAKYRWDTAYYKEKYYMYFGVVPVIILFIPLKLIGINILAYHATAIFIALSIIGIYLILYELCKKYCNKMPVSMYISIGTIVSAISSWYAVKYPNLYCTAISSGMCLALWGFYFCFKGFIIDEGKYKRIIDVTIGAIFSSLVFGCRPTIGFISLCYIPMFFYYINNRINKSEKIKIKEYIKEITNKYNLILLSMFIIPYIVVAILLMTYNYKRFENPLEFGQSYQLTEADQTNYSEGKSINLKEILYELKFYGIGNAKIQSKFPYIEHSGIFINFPILLFAFYNLKPSKKMQFKVKGLEIFLMITVGVIILFQVLWSPFPLIRYTMDFNFILGILLMIAECKLINNIKEKNIAKIAIITCIFAIIVLLTCFLLYFVSFDKSIDIANPSLYNNVKHFILMAK